MEQIPDIALKLCVAVLAGAVIGLNRSMNGKPTGVRLHALVSIGSALFVLACTDIVSPTDLSHVVQGIIGGIGFLGAGVIMHGGGAAAAPADASIALRRRAAEIHHLTTAASIWVTAGLGIACALGRWNVVLLTCVLALVVLILGIMIDRKLFGCLGMEDEGGEPIE